MTLSVLSFPEDLVLFVVTRILETCVHEGTREQKNRKKGKMRETSARANGFKSMPAWNCAGVRPRARQPHKHSKVVLISNCGFWEMDNFDPLVMHVQAICRNTCWEFAGAPLRSHGEALGYMVRKGLPVQDVLTAAKNAGRELAITGKISEENLKIIGRRLIGFSSLQLKLDEHKRWLCARAVTTSSLIAAKKHDETNKRA